MNLRHPETRNGGSYLQVFIVFCFYKRNFNAQMLDIAFLNWSPTCMYVYKLVNLL